MIMDQECDVNIFILGIIYPKIMCPNCVHTKLSCSGIMTNTIVNNSTITIKKSDRPSLASQRWAITLTP